MKKEKNKTKNKNIREQRKTIKQEIIEQKKY